MKMHYKIEIQLKLLNNILINMDVLKEKLWKVNFIKIIKFLKRIIKVEKYE